MSVKTNTFALARSPLVDKDGMLTWTGQQQLQLWNTQLNNALDQIGNFIGALSSAATVSGHTGTIGNALQNIDSSGVITSGGIDFTRSYLNKTTDNIADGTGSPLTGGKRAFQALDSNNRLQNSFRQTPVNVSNTPTAASSLSNTGSATAITIAAGTNQFAPSAVSYNAGSVDPGAYGTYYVYAIDPTFAGGAVTYQFSTTPSALTASEGVVPFGVITTTSGTSGSGGGYRGGGGRGYPLP